MCLGVKASLLDSNLASRPKVLQISTVPWLGDRVGKLNYSNPRS